MDFRFEKLDERKKPLHVANQLVEAIKKGEFEVGDKIPTEEELANKTGVSRASVREALAALRLGGIIKTKVGKGTYVQQVPTKDNIKDRILSILVDHPKPLELQEARAALEVGIVKIAAKKFSEEDEEIFDEILRDMESAVGDDNYQGFLKLHKEFHLQIAKSTRNKVIEDTLKSLQGIMNDKMWKKLEKMHLLPDKRNYLLESLKIHWVIFESLKENNPSDAREKMQNHFDRYS